MENEIFYQVSEEDQGIRIDKYISEQDDWSRTYIQTLIKENRVMVNEKKIKANYKIQKSDQIHLILPEAIALSIKAENIPLDILYEDKDIIVINKPKNMVVHPAAGHFSGTLVNALLYHCKGELSGINGVLRPGIVHRIDKDTTGALVVCKNNSAHLSLAKQLKEHSITRRYYAIVIGWLKEKEGIIDLPIGRHPKKRKQMTIGGLNSRSAITHYKVLQELKQNYTYLECKLETGRTHQIRVHMASLHHPLLGDVVYGQSSNLFHLEGQTLHAKILGFNHPTTNKYMEFEAPLPNYFLTLLNRLQ